MHETITVEAVRDYLEEQYGVVYESKQSYYDLMQAAGMSYHKSEKKNPRRDEGKVLERREEIKKSWVSIGKR
jgi:transposase